MLASRGVALGLGALNLTDLPETFNGGASPTQAPYYRKERVRRCYSDGSRKSSNAVSFACSYVPSSRKSRLAQIIDVDDSDLDMDQAKVPLPPAIKRRDKTLEQEEEKKKIMVKREFGRRTFWAACRALVFGALLVLMGAAMCTIGYYNDYFAAESVPTADNATATTVNPSKKLQFQSLTYIGPVIMGVGAFILMMACVTTLESRDSQARIQAQLDAEKTPLSRHNTLSKGHPVPTTAPAPSALKTSITQTVTSTDEPGKPIRKQELLPSKSALKQETIPKPTAYQQAELVAIPSGNGSSLSGGVVNRCFSRDDSKTASKPDTDSGPSGTTTTTLTWSKNGGPRCEADVVCKYPSTSCIDNLIRKPDERALLQRFLEDQSRLVEDRLTRRVQPDGQQKESEDGLRSASLDAPASAKIVYSCSRNFRSEEMASRRNVVAAEVHHASDASPSCGRVVTNSVDANLDQSSSVVSFFQDPATCDSHTIYPSTSSATFQDFESDKLLQAPVIAPDSLELFSPMSLGPDTPASVTQSYSIPPPAPFRPRSPSIDRSISGSYVTVLDGDDDLFNANLASCTSVRVYNTFSNSHPPKPPEWLPNSNPSPDPTNKKLYDSVFLAENLRQMATGGQQHPSKMDLTPRDERGNQNRGEETTRNSEQTGVLCKDWSELNANYLRNQQNL